MTITMPLAPPVEPEVAPRGRVNRFVRGRPDDPTWVRPALLGLLTATAVLYIWGLGASGWANSFYSAAVQAGTKSWKAFFFGSSDAANFITVDKPPASLWVMELSARIFGLNAWSILVPEALAGVATVGVVYAAVRRWFTAGAALIAGVIVALTPVAVLMFRFNNPDALLVLLLMAGAYAMLRAVESASTRWLLLAWSLVGFGFLTKMLQALLVLPAFALAYVIAAPTGLGRRIRQLVTAGGVFIASAGWWVAIVELWPKSSRPYIGGSQTNSVLELVFGYNGFGRLTGNESGSVGGGGRGTGQWGPTGLLRMFNSEFGGQISWLMPAALLLLVAGLVYRGRAPRTDRTRAALILWGGWLVVTALVFSLGKGIIHPYYTVALAPAVGALIGVGAATMWRRRQLTAARGVLSATLAVTAIWSYVLLSRTPTWIPQLRLVVLFGGLALATVLLVRPRWRGRSAVAMVVAAVAIGVAGPAAYDIQTASRAESGAIPSAGPAVAGSRSGPGGGFAGPQQAFGGATNRTPPQGFGGNNAAPGLGAATRGGNIGGLLNGSTPTAALVTVLDSNASDYTWVAAAIGSNQASGYQLATGDPVMAIGGFNGTDPSPTLAEFQQFVSEGRIHYFIAGGFGGGRGGTSSDTSSAISTWVASNFSSQTVGGVTLYDLTAPAAS
jgi:4-amino-4-deoxy-L-arabinose transferase-like glycosyltransferase